MRRRKGEGNGCIYWRTITRNGKDYSQAYYHWKEGSRKQSRYISKHLLERVQEAEVAKRPVIEILELLGVSQSPSKRRDRGEGSGCIYSRTITKNGKDYQQAYYQFEFWEEGDRVIKSSKYIPKGKLAQVQRLDEQKAPVRKILKLLGV